MTSVHEPPSILLRGGTVLTHDENDHVVPLHETDVLVRGAVISEIGKNISSPSDDTEVIDCEDKIICPSFVDTHHHLWQTQLKGRHAEHGLVAYMYGGALHLITLLALGGFPCTRGSDAPVLQGICFPMLIRQVTSIGASHQAVWKLFIAAPQPS